MTDINLGQYAVPVILTVVLAIVYKFLDKPDGTSYLPNQFKPLIAIALGIILGIVGMFYSAVVPSFKAWVDHILYGLMTGASAVGLWEGVRATVRPAK